MGDVAMIDITISLAVSHTPWVPDRVESMARLREQLGTVKDDLGYMRDPLPPIETYYECTEKAPVHYWAETMHRWGAEKPSSHIVFLQDDITIAPNFYEALRAMVDTHPDDIIGLESVHPGAMSLARAGARGYTTSDGLIGVGYVFPRSVLIEKLAWQTYDVKSGGVEAVTEDCLINMFAISSGRRIWHPCPTIIKHDTSLASTYGNDDHVYREPSVTWIDGDVCGWAIEDLAKPEFWPKRSTHLGHFYSGTRLRCKRWVKSWSEEKAIASDRDVGPELLTRWVALT